jgi:hypothetical protein
MGGGLMQLVAYGAQDIYLTGNPQITFFKVVYRRHTNFSMEVIEQTVNGSSKTADSATNGTVTISRNGDLVHKVYVTSDKDGINNGSALVNEVELEIGGQKIDKHYQEWNEIWNELSTPESKAKSLLAMTGGSGQTGTTGVGMVQVPLNFWFCRNPGLALPLIALQYHEVKLKFTWGTASTVGVADAECKVMVDYIYLDTDERRRFAQQSHEYLIEQLQRQTNEGAAGSLKLNFNHPVKELIWTSNQPYTDAKLKLNGHDRFAKQQEEFFQLRQPMDHHTAVPAQNLPPANHSLTFSNTLGDLKYAELVADAAHGTALATADDAGAASQLHYASGVLSVRGDTSETSNVTNFAAGTKIAIVPQAVADVNFATGASPTTSDIYVAVVKSSAVSAASANNTLILNITDPVGVTRLAGTGARETITAIGAGTGDNKVHLYYFPKEQARTSQLTEKVNVYSFALKPEEHQPSGTCNFSRIDNAQLHFETKPHDSNLNVYAVNYNVLRIMSGMGGLAYSN